MTVDFLFIFASVMNLGQLQLEVIQSDTVMSLSCHSKKNTSPLCHSKKTLPRFPRSQNS